MLSSSSSKPPTQQLLQSADLISQGAEAKVYKAYLRQVSTSGLVTDHGAVLEALEPVLLKYRFHKHYRHPSLDASLTRQRIAGEARALMRCMRSGVTVPGIRMVDVNEGVLGIEWIDGKSVRQLLPGGAELEDISELEEADEMDEIHENGTADPIADYGVSRDALMDMIGVEIAKMHLADIIHGDLTTSNMMLRKQTSDLVLIDFGLAYHSTLVEDKAVDLYVLERAFASTHPDSEPLFAGVLSAYEKRMRKHWLPIKKRLDDVRLRGRKRSMVG
ncbi:kinase-like domain-containing protein [Suillus fuscotomentosus]|uniref:EKC/KEOPS complex subunit BUD32 n=1 Tax=Suillus fuscotomentosus TaxID=1912939 RepID=A0AAD4DTG0_9AGAM|nr:kinase-like domain-containing protein [Suillus fuscotomentosus]KAG1893633.1 kinase-like domain-containing protein [Suillus fuscotomentosus]